MKRRAPVRCAKCAAPGKRLLYRHSLPPGIPAARCTKQGGMWEIPLCGRHARKLERCSTPGCRGRAERNGLCNACTMRIRRRSLYRNCPNCLRCGVSFEEAPYQSCGLCKSCHRAVQGAEGTARYSAKLRELNGTPPLKLLCQQLGASAVALMLGTDVAQVGIWIKSGSPPAVRAFVVDELTKLEEAT